MRTHGKLTKWNDDRGFGFIEPAMGTEEIFVHVSAFPRDGVRPRIGEVVSFETEFRGDGRKQAVGVMRPGHRSTPHRRRRPQSTPSRQGPAAALTALVSMLLFAVIGWYGYSRLTVNRAVDSTSIPAPAARATPTPTPRANPMIPAPTSRPVATGVATPAQPFHCDGRTRCSQMTSCAEATYFIKQCPGTQMDGDGDGVPCESQWCPGGWTD